MGKRRRFSRWKRLPGVYRIGDDKPADPNLEPQRLSLYIPGTLLDSAEMQAVRLGYADAQEYCTEVVIQAIEAERIKDHVADVEARRGALEGFHEISADAEYLADLTAASAAHREPANPQLTPPSSEAWPTAAVPVTLPDMRDAPGITFIDPTEEPAPGPPAAPALPAPVADASTALARTALSRSAEVILRHAAQLGDDPLAFLPSLRRGEPVGAAEVAELAQALHELERETRGERSLDRGLTFALHRLAFESQILQTDAWPGAFDVWTVDMVRAVQEAVERILSGQDIRYYPLANGPAESQQPELPL